MPIGDCDPRDPVAISPPPGGGGPGGPAMPVELDSTPVGCTHDIGGVLTGRVFWRAEVDETTGVETQTLWWIGTAAAVAVPYDAIAHGDWGACAGSSISTVALEAVCVHVDLVPQLAVPVLDPSTGVVVYVNEDGTPIVGDVTAATPCDCPCDCPEQIDERISGYGNMSTGFIGFSPSDPADAQPNWDDLASNVGVAAGGSDTRIRGHVRIEDTFYSYVTPVFDGVALTSWEIKQLHIDAMNAVIPSGSQAQMVASSPTSYQFPTQGSQSTYGIEYKAGMRIGFWSEIGVRNGSPNFTYSTTCNWMSTPLGNETYDVRPVAGVPPLLFTFLGLDPWAVALETSLFFPSPDTHDPVAP